MKRTLIALLGVGALVLLSITAGISLAQTRLNPAKLKSFQILSDLNLSESQQNQLQQLRSATRGKIEALLTQEQKQRFWAALQQGEGVRAAIAAMNLNDQQKTELRDIFQSSRTQWATILTPAQKQKLQENLRDRTKLLQ
uniref:LTXXQ motif family protein n=1 Tax=Cyanothece sp. (strain PCC 7425 / ATCC 29141) TaxID=395961 RepID=B8HNY6_CYAP4